MRNRLHRPSPDASPSQMDLPDATFTGWGADELVSPNESDPKIRITDLLIAWRAGDVGSLRA